MIERNIVNGETITIVQCDICERKQEFAGDLLSYEGFRTNTDGQQYCLNCFDNAYLSRPILANVVYSITDTEVVVRSSSTTFIECCTFKKHKQRDLLQLYKNVLDACKSKGVKIRYREHYKRSLTENWQAYEEQCQSAQKAFDDVVKNVKRVKVRGIHMGYSDDKVLFAAIKYAASYNAYFNRNTVISRIAEIYSMLTELYNKLQGSSMLYANFISVSL